MAEFGEAFGLRAVLVSPGPQPRGGQPQPVLLGGPDRAVQLVRDRGHDARAAAGLCLRRHHSGHGLAGEGGALRGDRGLGCGADQGDLAGHPGEFGLHRRELCQRPAELLTLLHVRHGQLEGALGRPRDEQ